jgi:lariat debranching enzyme
MAITGWFGDTHGNLKLMWQMATEWQDRTGIALDWLFQVGDFGIFPHESRLDPPTRRHAEKHGYSLKVAVGDFPEVLTGEYEIPIPTYFIRGNHEDQQFLLNLQKERKNYCLRHPIEVAPNLFYVPDGCIFKLDGITIAGWGGCWGKNTWEMDYWSQARLQSPRRMNHMTQDVFERLRRERFDVLVTHDAPTGCGLRGSPNPDSLLLDPESLIGNEGSGMGMPQIRQLIEEVRPKYHFCGHWHEFHKTIIGSKFGDQVATGATTSFVLDKTVPDGQDRHCMEIVEL